MLRMGKGPKPEQPENQKQTFAPQPQQQPAYASQPPEAPPQQQYAQPEPPTPAARPEAERPSTPRAVMESESLAREIKDGTMSGFVGGGTTLSGEAVFKGMLRVDGHLTGQVKSEKGTLIVSSGGRVDADIRVATAKINGVVNGDIVATERLEFGRTAQVFGDIQTPVLLIEQGAVFEGGCRMQAIDAGKSAGQTTEKPRANDKESAGRNSSSPRTVGAAGGGNGASEILEPSSAAS